MWSCAERERESGPGGVIREVEIERPFPSNHPRCDLNTGYVIFYPRCDQVVQFQLNTIPCYVHIARCLIVVCREGVALLLTVELPACSRTWLWRVTHRLPLRGLVLRPTRTNSAPRSKWRRRYCTSRINRLQTLAVTMRMNFAATFHQLTHALLVATQRGGRTDNTCSTRH